MLCNSHGKSTACTLYQGASGFPVIIKFQPASCNLQNIPAENRLVLHRVKSIKSLLGVKGLKKKEGRRGMESSDVKEVWMSAQ